MDGPFIKIKIDFVSILGTFEMESLNHLIWNYFLNKIIIYLTDCVYPPLGFLKALVMAKEMSKVINTLEISTFWLIFKYMHALYAAF